MITWPWELKVLVHWVNHFIGLVIRCPPQELQSWVWFSVSLSIFSQVQSYQWLKNWYPSVYPARCLVFRVSTGACWPAVTVRSATSFSLWQQVQLSEQNCPWDTLACCWDDRQTTNHNKNIALTWWSGACGLKTYSRLAVSQVKSSVQFNSYLSSPERNSVMASEIITQ